MSFYFHDEVDKIISDGMKLNIRKLPEKSTRLLVRGLVNQMDEAS